LASDQLVKRYQIEVSKETVGKWMVEAGLWESRSRKVQAVHCWRPRRSGYGELVQWDTSDHDWLEGRGERVRSRVRSVAKPCQNSMCWTCWGSLLSEKQMPQLIEIIRSVEN